MSTVSVLRSNDVKNIRNFIVENCLVQENLKKSIQSSVEHFSSIKSVKGLRRKLKLPVRGQRTKTNRKTCRRMLSQ